MDQDTESGCDLIKQVALEEVDHLKTIRTLAWDEHSHSFRWLMASLLAVNGAACLAVVGNEHIPGMYKLGASGMYLGGILFAFLVAVFGQHSTARSLAPLQRYIGYWITVVDDGQRDLDIENDLNEKLRQAARVGAVAKGAGWVSALLFFGGALLSGKGMLQNIDMISKASG